MRRLVAVLALCAIVIGVLMVMHGATRHDGPVSQHIHSAVYHPPHTRPVYRA